MTDRQLIDRLLFLAQTAVDQALDLNYDDAKSHPFASGARVHSSLPAGVHGDT